MESLMANDQAWEYGTEIMLNPDNHHNIEDNPEEYGLSYGVVYTVDIFNTDSLCEDTVALQDMPGYHWYASRFMRVGALKSSAQERGERDSRFAKKFDQGKLLMRPLINGLATSLIAIAAVLSYGAQKYEENSWQSVPDGRKRYEDALIRHQLARGEGQTYDEESGLPHIAHMACNLLFIMWFEIKEGIITNWTKFNEPK